MQVPKNDASFFILALEASLFQIRGGPFISCSQWTVSKFTKKCTMYIVKFF